MEPAPSAPWEALAPATALAAERCEGAANGYAAASKNIKKVPVLLIQALFMARDQHRLRGSGLAMRHLPAHVKLHWKGQPGEAEERAFQTRHSVQEQDQPQDWLHGK